MVFIALYGPGYGGVITLRLILQAEYFGRRAFGSIQGLIMAIGITGTMSLPLLTGWFYDLFGSYRSSWLLWSVMIFAVVPPAFMAKPPPKHRTAPADEKVAK